MLLWMFPLNGNTQCVLQVLPAIGDVGKTIIAVRFSVRHLQERLRRTGESLLSPQWQTCLYQWSESVKLQSADVEFRHAWNQRNWARGMSWHQFCAKAVNTEARSVVSSALRANYLNAPKLQAGALNNIERFFQGLLSHGGFACSMLPQHAIPAMPISLQGICFDNSRAPIRVRVLSRLLLLLLLRFLQSPAPSPQVIRLSNLCFRARSRNHLCCFSATIS